MTRFGLDFSNEYRYPFLTKENSAIYKRMNIMHALFISYLFLTS